MSKSVTWHQQRGSRYSARIGKAIVIAEWERSEVDEYCENRSRSDRWAFEAFDIRTGRVLDEGSDGVWDFKFPNPNDRDDEALRLAEKWARSQPWGA